MRKLGAVAQPRVSGEGSSARRIMAAATETGSAKAMVPVLAYLSKNGHEIKVALSDAAREFAECHFPEFTQADYCRWKTPAEAEAFAESFAPEALVVGTSPKEGIEKGLTSWAGSRNIFSVSIIDERHAFRARFADLQSHLSDLPDRITVMDEECKAQAVREGLPSERIVVTGSPLLSCLKEKAGQVRVMMSDAISEADRAVRILFVSETFLRDNGTAQAKKGRLSGFLGFTEESVKEDIVDILSKSSVRAELVERMHPSDDRPPERTRIREGLTSSRSKGSDLWRDLVSSDLVIGMRSMALTEAAVLGCTVASYQPGLIGENQCAAVRFGLADALSTKDELSVWVRERIKRRNTGFVGLSTDMPFYDPEAAGNNAHVILSGARVA